MDYGQILDLVGNAVYLAMAVAALYGVFTIVLLVRAIGQKRFVSRNQASEFLGVVREELRQKNFDGIAQLCDTPALWSKAVPQLMLVALANRGRPANKLHRIVAEKFERDVLADLEYRTSWISTIVKSAPMLGLLGTVIGMINAFGKIAGASQEGLNPKVLADDISFALVTTALGLAIAIPLVLAGNMIHVRIGKLQDTVQEDMGEFLDELDEATA